MDYSTYLAQGWPIASGVIEGACRHFVKDRFELSGMRWTQAGAENLLHLRAVAENEDWDDYHHFRKRQRHARLYALPFPELGSLDDQALDFQSPLATHQKRQVPAHTDSEPGTFLDCETSPVTATVNSDRLPGYYELPLAV